MARKLLRSSKFPRRRILQFVGLTSAATLLVGCAASESPEAYPTGNLEYIIPYNPGGSTDPLAREFATQMSEKLGVSNTPMNMPGGDESIGLTQVITSDPDGYTLGLGSSAGLMAQPRINDSLQYEGASDATPIIKMVDVPYGLLVSGDSPYQTLDDFIAAAKADPGGLRVSSPNRMGGSAFSLYALEESAGIQTTLVPSTGGSGEAALAVMGGDVEAMVGTASGQKGLVESGDLRLLAHTGPPEYSEFFPDSIAFEEAGYDIPFSGDYMTLAPADLPDVVREKMVDAATEAAQGDEWKSWTDGQAIIAESLTGDELNAWIDEQDQAIENAIKLGEERDQQ